MKMRNTNSAMGLRRAAFLCLAILSLTLFTTSAGATCFGRSQGTSPRVSPQLMAQLNNTPVASSNTIVGLWHAVYTTSDGQVFQESYDMWHTDGTELETANVNPITGNTCIGVWKEVGADVHLHHVGWGFDPAGNLIGPFTVDDVLAMSNHGNTYSGSFDFKQYATNGTLLLEVSGTINATRIGVH